MKKLILSILIAQCGLASTVFAAEIKMSCASKAMFSVNVKTDENMSRQKPSTDIMAATCCSWAPADPWCMKGC